MFLNLQTPFHAALAFMAMNTVLLGQVSGAGMESPTRAIVQDLGALPDGERLPRPSGARVAAIVDVQQNSYQRSQKIMIRVGLRNDTGRVISITHEAPWHVIRLEVFDANGTQLTSGPIASDAVNGSTHNVSWDVGQTRYLSWEGEDWISIDKFGFSLSVPGRYKIVAVPYASGYVTDERGQRAIAFVTILP